ncbi:hypothetical protein V9T40_007125 [Parthenolecanium corni]|uniref:E3 UFM1-protein ligase 1 homolog n=1 Tax=Parthenolecanium corni TaxID=536013 RepID=A0AAN9YBJ8_9HEMI
MSSFDWEEVKRLAADFQRTQFSSAAQKLSERNCVEIITKLTQLKLLDVVFTNDGKSYITPKYLIKEIKDELYVHNGRANLIDLAKSLNVDASVITSLAHEVVKEDSSVRVILGQLIDHSYVINVAEEINDRLQQHGLINVSELARTFDLPADFIHSIIKENSGRIIRGVKQDKQDVQTYYTENYLNRYKSIVKGALAAITRPTQISTIISHCGIKENVFFSIIDSLIESKQVPGIVTERCGSVCSYIPQIYIKSQTEWVKNFFTQNGYLEYDALSRSGINDPKSFIEKSVQSQENLQYLKNCAIGQGLLDQIEASVEEAVASQSWINILSILPTVIDAEDAEIILQKTVKGNRNLSSVQIFNQVYAVSEAFLNTLYSRIADQIMPENVNQAVNSGTYEQYIIESKVSSVASDGDKRELSRKEERKKRTTVGKSGGGTQGRETKTKVTKKKYGQKSSHKIDSDEEELVKPKSFSSFEFVSYEEIQNVIQSDKSFQDEDFDHSEFIENLQLHYYPLINKAALTLAQSVYEARQANINSSKRKLNAELQDNIISLYQDFKLYQRAIKEFNDEDCQSQLNKYLLKSTGTQLTNACFTFISDKCEDFTSPKSYQKIITSVDNKEVKDAFTKLQKAMNGSSIEEFVSSVDDVLSVLNIMMKKMDKKKEKALLESHKQALLNKLEETDDPPLVLHLASLILFQNVTQNMVNASGRFVTNILGVLEKRLPAEDYQPVHQYHTLVLKFFKLSEDDEEYASINGELKENTPLLKQKVSCVTKK